MRVRFGGVLLLVCLIFSGVVTVSAQGGEHDHNHEDEATHEHEAEHAKISDLTPWVGESISIWAVDESHLQPAIDAILASTPELALEDVLTYLEEGNATSFDTFVVEGQLVTFNSDGGSVTCPYVYVGDTPVVEYPTAAWFLFATSDETCNDYRYLLLMPPHASEEGSIPHYHMRYGASDLEGLIAQGAPWYPSLYPADSEPTAIMNSWIVNARMVGLYIASAYGIDVVLTEEELAAQHAIDAAD
jgi:Predicted periplasmic or secreted protein